MAQIGYARVSTDDQNTDSQRDDLSAAGCRVILEETASGGSRSRPALAKALARLGPGDCLVVARIDRLARSLSHLLEVIDGIEARGAHFRSLRDPIDTATPQGKFALQVLGAAAELERALIRERTRAGLRAAKARGRTGGNPALKRREPAALAALSAARNREYLAGLLATMDAWMPKVRRLRPAQSWATVAKALGRLGSPDRPWTAGRLSKAVHRLVAEGLADRQLIAPAPRHPARTDLLPVVAGIKGADPGLSLRAIAQRLRDLHLRPPRGGDDWSPSTVRSLLDRAARLGLLPGRGARDEPDASPPPTGFESHHNPLKPLVSSTDEPGPVRRRRTTGRT